MRTATFSAFFVFLFVLTSDALAWEDNYPILTVRSVGSYSVEPYVTILEDVENRLTIKDVMTEAVERKFAPSTQEHINFGYSHSAFWVRLEVLYDPTPYQDSSLNEWYYEVGKTLIKEAELFVVYPDGHWEKVQSDVRISYQERPIRLVNSVFPVPMKKGEKRKLYLRVKSDSALYFPMTLWNQKEFVHKVAREEILYGIFFGGMSVMFLYNLFLFFSIRNLSYAYYACYLLSALSFVGIESGHGAAFMTDGRVLFDKAHVPIAIWCTWIFGLLFTHRFLEIPTRHPLLNQFFTPLLVYSILSFGLTLMLPLQAALIVSIYFCGYASAFMPFLGIYTWYSGNKNASYFTLAWLFNVTGFVTVSLVATGRAPATQMLLASLPLGTLLEATMLSFALAERIKSAQKEVVLAQNNFMINLSKYRSLFENAMEGIYHVNLRGKLANANPSMAAILGFSSARELISAGGSAIKVLYHNSDVKWRDLRRGKSLRNEIGFVNNQGNSVVVEHSARLIRDTHGRPSYIEGRVVDLTERQHREQAERDRLRERREKLAAEIASDAKSRFLKNMSFEIRSSLTPIIGYSESLLDPELKQTSKHELVSGVTANAQALLQLVNDILDYSKIEAKKMPVEFIEFDPLSIIRSVETIIAPLAKRKNIIVNVEYKWPLPEKITTDPTRLKQILHNLLKKTITFTASSVVNMQVSWDDNERQIIFDIFPGEKNLYPHEAQPMLDNDDSVFLSTVLERDGISVAIARQLTDLLSGKWHALYDEKSGYKFRFSVGCTISAHGIFLHALPNVVDRPRKAENTVPQLVGRILLAEDNPVNQKLISRIISKTGAELTVANDGEQAFIEASKTSFHLILMDVNMPVMGGLEATQKLRESGYSQPIFALTAEHGSEEVQASLAAGCNGHLTKPLDINSFYQTLAKCLAERCVTP